MINRKFKCYACEYEWELPHGDGQMGINLKCPKCNSQNVHRIHIEGEWGRKRFCGANNSNLDEGKNK